MEKLKSTKLILTSGLMKLPKVSILIVSRNAAKDLPRLFRSIKKLKYPKKNLEVIFVDDASSDNSIEIAAKFGAQTFRFEKRQGRAKVRNFALKKASYNLIAWIDSDCEIVDEYWIQNMLKYLKGKVVGVGSPQLKPKDSLLQKTIWYLPGMAIPRGPKKASWAPTTGSLFYKRALKEIGGYDENLITSEDLDACWKLSRKGYEFFWSDRAEIIHHFRATLTSFIKQHFERGIYGAVLAEKNRKQFPYIYNILKYSLVWVPIFLIFLYSINPILISLLLLFPLFIYLSSNFSFVRFYPKLMLEVLFKERDIRFLFILLVLAYARFIPLFLGVWRYYLGKLFKL